MQAMCRWARWAYGATAGLGWVVAALDAVPHFDGSVAPSLSRLALGVALAASLVLALVWVQRPAEDVWQAGREHGRREALREVSGRRTVVSLADRRRRGEREYG